MIAPASWLALLTALGLGFGAILLVIWWRQQTFRWPIVLLLCTGGAIALSWWSGQVFAVEDYRAGCDGVCAGYRGAPFQTHRGGGTESEAMPAMFALNTLVYLLILLAWAGLIRVILGISRGAADSLDSAPMSSRQGQGSFWARAGIGFLALIAPLALMPLVLPPPEAKVRGDPQRIAVNARREVFMYDQLSPIPVLRVGLKDVRPRPDDQPGMRVCLQTYSFFYLPTGQMYMDMAPEGVHSTGGGVLPLDSSCWGS